MPEPLALVHSAPPHPLPVPAWHLPAASGLGGTGEEPARLAVCKETGPERPQEPQWEQWERRDRLGGDWGRGRARAGGSAAAAARGRSGQAPRSVPTGARRGRGRRAEGPGWHGGGAGLRGAGQGGGHGQPWRRAALSKSPRGCRCCSRTRACCCPAPPCAPAWTRRATCSLCAAGCWRAPRCGAPSSVSSPTPATPRPTAMTCPTCTGAARPSLPAALAACGPPGARPGSPLWARRGFTPRCRGRAGPRGSWNRGWGARAK